MGAGFVLDVFVGFLWRSIARTFMWVWSSRWNRESGVVTGVSVRPAHSHGCPLVTVEYRVGGGGEAVSKIPFLFQNFAEDYARGMRPKDVAIIRVNRKKTSQTIFFSADQT